MASEERVEREAKLRLVALTTWWAIGVILLLAGVFWLLGRLWPALTPFAIAAIVVFVLRGPVDWLECRGVPRGWAVFGAYLIAVLVLGLIGQFFVPSILRQVTEFVHRFPEYYASAVRAVESVKQQYTSLAIPDWTRDAIADVLKGIATWASGLSAGAAKGLVSAGGTLVGFVVNFALALVIAFWALKDLPTIKREIIMLFGDKYEEDASLLAHTLSTSVGGYIRGQTISSLVTGSLAAIGLALLGVPYSLVLGLITFVLNYIPYVGPFVGGLIAAVVALTISPATALWAVLIVVASQQFTDSIVSPRVMSEQVDLHPTLVIFSLLVGGTLFGFFGLLFAIPLASVAKGMFVYYFEKRTNVVLSSHGGVLFKNPPEPPCRDGASPRVGGRSMSAESREEPPDAESAVAEAEAQGE